MQAHHYKTWSEAAGMPETVAPLPRLPNGVKLSDDFPEPIRYDPDRKRLIYRGFMSSASYRFLHNLSTDPAYVAALDVLFQASAYVLDKPAGGRLWRWLVAFGAVAAAIAAAWRFLR
jgi:hypothetical protein